ncbi:DUF2267 domain-containing protein [Fodinibius halophilus]|uniref:DUF2267 domain-containing protein n=1 Tax=Fodinibius halophilus TaxID=1736908 RepID=A0A6M1T8V0_9BACT|nr:DUF2267 domain-containing protein [Fodinibius halophilus]NGP89855.1 DUF2267 domain-containing protein [Fodinibius halophilus]
MADPNNELHWFNKLTEEESCQKSSDKKRQSKSKGKENMAIGKVNFDKYGRNARQWVIELTKLLDLETERERAWILLRVVLHAIRDRLSPTEVFHLSAQFPMLIRGAFFEGYHYTGEPKKFHVDELKSRIEEVLPEVLAGKEEEVFKAVLIVLYNHISTGELDDIYENMPKDIKQLWDENLNIQTV